MRRGRRVLIGAACSVGLALFIAGWALAARASLRHTETPPVLEWPLRGEVTARFNAADRYGSGHRGIDIVARPGEAVSASHDGTVTFVGSVAGVLSVTLIHESGWRTSYSYLGTTSVEVGERVSRGDRLGTAGSLHGSSSAGVHFSLRIGDDYVDPGPFLVEGAPVLLPPPSDGGGAGGETDRESASADGDARSQELHGEDGLRSTGAAGNAGGGPPRLVPEGCSVTLLDCGGTAWDLWRRGPQTLLRTFRHLARLGEELLHQTGIVADWALRAEQALARMLRSVIAETVDGLASVAAAAAGIPLAVSSQAAAMVEPISPGAAARVRRRGRRAAVRLEAASREFQRLLEEAVEPVAVHAALREELTGLARFETDRLERSKSCTPASELSFRRPGSGGGGRDDFLYVVVPGFGSSYEPDQGPLLLEEALRTSGKEVFAYSYAGFEKGPDGSPLARPFTPEDSFQDIRISAEILADQIQGLADAYPGRRIVVVAHSQGGVVARYALSKVYPQRGRTDRVAAFVSIASPQRGSGGAKDLVRLAESEAGKRLLVSHAGLSESALQATSLRQMAWGSRFMDELGSSAPAGIPTTSIALATDMVVPPPETFLEGASNILIDTGQAGIDAHSHVVTHPSTLLAIEAAARGSSLCQTRQEVLGAAWTAALTTVSVERTRDLVADAFEATATLAELAEPAP